MISRLSRTCASSAIPIANVARESHTAARALRLAVTLAVVCGSCGLGPDAYAQTTPIASIAFSNEVEASLVRAMQTLKAGGIKPAIQELDAALEKNPNFRLGHLLKGDLLMAKAGSPVAFGSTAQPELVASLRDEARVRLNRYFDGPPIDSLPTALIQLAPQHQHALLVDSEKARIYVFKNVDGQPQLVADFYISGGKNGFEKERAGDQRTPLGVYHAMSSMGRDKLTDFYGAGAFPLNYPNEWDKRLAKTGSGIWIHGTPSTTYSRPPRASDGCVVLTNEDFANVAKFVEPGVTPIVIVPTVNWQSPEQWHASRDAFSNAFAQWKRDWESLGMDRYLAHYSTHFNADGKSFGEWASNKRRINASKNFVKVGVSNLSVFEYPLSSGTPPMVMVTFDQEYKSNNNATRMKKRQYWLHEDGQWKIIYESVAT